MHTATAELLGTTEGAATLAVDSIEMATIPDKMKPVVRYAQKLTQHPDGMTQDDANEIFNAGWDEIALYHTVTVTALFNL